MVYEITKRSDVNYGTILTVQIPTADVDWYALYTLEADTPDFIVPFHYHLMDDMVELTFLPENRRMLRYYGGEQTAAEYSALFTNLMLPLQNGADWFLKAFCFVMDFDWIFYDVATQAISYLYFPVKEDCGSIRDIVSVIRQVNNNFRVNNRDLENKVLRAITDDNFRVGDFINIFKDVQPQKSNPPKQEPVPVKQPPQVPVKEEPKKPVEVPKAPFLKKPEKPEKPVKAEKPVEAPKKNILMDDFDDDLDIDFFSDGAQDGKGATDSPNPEKKALIHKLFGKGESKQVGQKPVKESKKEAKKEKKEQPVMGRQVISGAAADIRIAPQRNRDLTVQTQYEADDATVVVPQSKTHQSFARLEYHGKGNFPALISINMKGKSMFSIGRFDSGLNKKQSDFEFPSNTKEVSRRHAVIEQFGDDYYITDIGSLAGTFVNGESIGLNKSVKLENQDSVSFGEAGADYIFRK